MIRVLVFPSSNEPGLEIVRSLIDQPGIEVHGGSCFSAAEDTSAALLLRHTRFPLVSEKSFRSTLEQYIRKEKITIVFPSMEKVVSEFSNWKMDGVRFLTQTPEIAATVESKQATYETLSGHLPLPEIFNSTSEPQYPIYGKPIAGSGGRGNMIINNDEDLNWARTNGLLITEYLPGKEIVAYNLSDLQGNQLWCLTKAMGRWRGGASQLGEIRDEPLVRGYAKAIANRLKPIGFWFAQFKMDKNGTYKLMEVNTRPGGASGIARLAGVNLPLLTVKLFSGQSVDIPAYTRELSWVRNLQPFVSTAPFHTVVWDYSALVRPVDGNLRPHVVAALFDLANRGITQKTYGDSVPEIVTQWHLHRHFEKRHKTLEESLRDMEQPEKTIFVTDQGSDQIMINRQAPQARVISTGALDVMGKEKL